MYKSFVVVFIILVFTGCVERSNKLNPKHHRLSSKINNKMKHDNLKYTLKRSVLDTPLSKDKLFASNADELIFLPLKKTYQKFLNSEIHGHVVYISPSGKEVFLNNTLVYLLPSSQHLNSWYKHYYLNNKIRKQTALKVFYANKTYINLSKNFGFYGVSPGIYYVIISSIIPKTNKKVYIVKKIKIMQHQKLMTVFTKKL